MLDRIAEAAKEQPDSSKWIKAMGARVAAWTDGRYPTRQELDEASGGRCVVVQSFDHHAMAVSSAVLRASGIGHRASAEVEAFVQRDPIGEPTGVLLESACKAVWSAMPSLSDEEHLECTQEGSMLLGAMFFEEVHDMLSTPRLARALLELERRMELSTRVWMYAPPEHLPGVQRVFDEVVGQGARQSKHRMVRLAGLKLFADGTLNSRTAFMLTPYADGGGNGHAFYTQAQLAEYIADAAKQGYQTAVHAIGDAAVRRVLDAYESAGKPTIPGGPALRIEHAQFTDEADVPRFAAMNVVASLQPCHLLTDIEAIERSMPHRADRAFALRDFIDAARRAGRDERELVWLGSDAPVVRPDPGDNLQAAIHRRRISDGKVVGDGQSVSESDVLACYQIHS